MTRLTFAAAAALTFIASVSFAQAVAIVPAEPETWQQAMALWWPSLMQTALAGIALFLTMAIRSVAAMLPEFIRAWIDSKRQRDLHSAIMSKVAELIAAGRWPNASDMAQIGGSLGRDLLSEVRDYGVKSVPQAMRHYGLDQVSAKGDAVLSALATRFGLELDPMTSALRDAGAPV